MGSMREAVEAVYPITGKVALWYQGACYRLAVQNQSISTGWFKVRFFNRSALVLSPVDIDDELVPELCPVFKGWYYKGRFYSEKSGTEGFKKLFLAPQELKDFSFVNAMVVNDHYVYIEEALEVGVGKQALEAFLEGSDPMKIKGLSPSLQRAIHFALLTREEDRKKRAQEESIARAIALRGKSEQLRIEGRLQELDDEGFSEVLKTALSFTGATFVSFSAEREGGVLVRYIYRGYRLACVVERSSLRVRDAGICLTENGIRGDSFFTLESLPNVVDEAIEQDVLVIYRRH